MKYVILIFALCLGILVGVTLFMPTSSTITGAVPHACYVENELCACGETVCVCGNHTVPKEYCT